MENKKTDAGKGALLLRFPHIDISTTKDSLGAVCDKDNPRAADREPRKDNGLTVCCVSRCPNQEGAYCDANHNRSVTNDFCHFKQPAV
jgi:hypothetical protein